MSMLSSSKKKGKKDKKDAGETEIKNAKMMANIIKQRRENNVSYLKKVLELCEMEIERCVQQNWTHCIFEVPDFLIGYPLYDINECIVYILRKLQENDYKVAYYFPKTIFISWPIEENEDDLINKKFLEALQGAQTKHLEDIQQTHNYIYKKQEKQEKQEEEEKINIEKLLNLQDNYSQPVKFKNISLYDDEEKKREKEIKICKNIVNKNKQEKQNYEIEIQKNQEDQEKQKQKEQEKEQEQEQKKREEMINKEKEKEKEEKSNKNNDHEKKENKGRKKKTQKPISDLKSSGRFVLDLSSI